MNADYIFKIASGQKSWYFYAATSINISGKVIQFIEENFCDNFFYDHFNNINLFDFSFLLYSEFFYEFNNFWVKGNYNDIMMVNSLLETFIDNYAEDIFKREIIEKKLF